MRLIYFLFALLTLFSSCQLATKDSNEVEIKTFLKEFYTKYMTACAKWPTSHVEMEAVKLQYCTPALLEELSEEERDYDPIVNAQDCDVAWLKDLTVTKDLNKEDIYIVSYSASPEYEDAAIKLRVININGGYRIDSIFN